MQDPTFIDSGKLLSCSYIFRSYAFSLLVMMLPAIIMVILEFSANIVIPTTFSNDWTFVLKHVIDLAREDDKSLAL